MVYPLIESFLAELTARQPRRDFTRYILPFGEKGYLGIEELGSMTRKEIEDAVGMPEGYARILHEEIMLAIDKCNKAMPE